MFLVFEGNDYVGKTYLANGFSQFLVNEKIPHKYYAEPGGVSKTLRTLAKSVTDNTVRQVLMTASRVMLNKAITPYLKKNGLVLCDRYTPSMVIYGTLDRIDNDLIQAMAKQSIWVDLYVHVTADNKTVMDRFISRKGVDAPEGSLSKVLRRNTYYQERFDQIANIIGCSKILTLDGTADLEYNVEQIGEQLGYEF